MKMITKLLISTFLVMTTFGLITSAAWAGKYENQYQKETLSKIQIKECLSIESIAEWAKVEQDRGFSLQSTQTASLVHLRVQMRRRHNLSHYPDAKRVYRELVSFVYSGGDPSLAQARCKDSHPDFFAKEIKALSTAQSVKKLGRIAKQ